VIHLDTHVVVWLVSGLSAKVPPAEIERLENDEVAISPMVRLELEHLHEIGRLRHPADRILGELQRATALVEDATPFAEVIREATGLTWTRDPFDRIIVGQALAAGCPLVTADQTLRERLPDHTRWG
jgi:PIN domain nuclease of toxin-antitoxin system